jgi:hypothetical protein
MKKPKPTKPKIKPQKIKTPSGHIMIATPFEPPQKPAKPKKLPDPRKWRGGRTHMNNPDNPEVLAVMPLPQWRRSSKLIPEERRRREIMLTRVMLLAIDLVLSGERLGLETARDLVREIKHTFPELAAEWNDL